MRIRTNIISIGLILLALFIVAIYLIGKKISDVGNDMNNANMKEACRYRAESVAYEFKKTEELQRLAREFFGRSGSYQESDLFSLLKTMQQLDPKLSRTWFFRGTTDSLRLLERNSTVFRKMKLSGAELDYMHTLLDSINNYHFSGTYNEDGNTYWTTVEAIEPTASRHALFGFDILLTDLHSYFAEFNGRVSSYVFIVNEQGILLSHPDEKLLGTSPLPKEELDSIKEVLKTKSELEMMVHSAFLSSQVFRVYYPLLIGNEKWVIAVNVPQYGNKEILDEFHRYTAMIAVITVVIFAILLFFAQHKWRKEYRLRRKIERESLELHLQQLKNQINPHFLFNSLNSLSVLIGSDSVLAREFVLKLSKVYRYLLETRNESLSTVKEEIEFTRQYYFLQKIRFGEQLDLMIEVSPDSADAKIPSISLQMLVENAIKHNQVTIQNPLHIKIYTRGDWLFVENNYQPRVESSEESMGVGFERIRAIYEFYSHEKFVCSCQNGCYVCQLPLLRNR
ncbi:sensor histidine kinase [Odoribacter sp. AF15-53]|nr:sensor histidine kinase [Odoribacter sp. AF15-53]